jgi:hypothetical protein
MTVSFGLKLRKEVVLHCFLVMIANAGCAANIQHALQLFSENPARFWWHSTLTPLQFGLGTWIM